MSFPLDNRAALPADRLATLAAAVAAHRTIKRALDWSLSLPTPSAPADVIAQDEFSHDVVLGVADPAGCWLVYDCTRVGEVLGVAVWGHLPSPDELLDARLARGWQPRPTETLDGPVILGHAASRQNAK